MTARTFPLSAVLGATTGFILSERGVEEMYDVLGFMTGDTLWTHQLPRAMSEAKPHILAQHPDLADVEVPEEFSGEAHVRQWMAEQVARFGPERELTPMPADEHTSIDPVAELAMMNPGVPVAAVEIDEESTAAAIAARIVDEIRSQGGE